MRSMWKGDISFGLVNIPIAIIPVEESKDLHFHLLDPKNNARVRYKRVNAETGEEVAWNDIVRGYELDKDRYLIIDEEAIAKARPDIFNLINIEEFVNLSEIDMLYFDKPYY